ncbi:MAG: hypothetical protein P8Z38_08870 [Robiginitalea sp.]
MKKTLRLPDYLLVFGIPILLIGGLVLLSKSLLFARQPEDLSLGITIDLLLTVPLIYFFLIWKTNLPKTTVVAFLFLGVLACSAILPADRPQYLDVVRAWGLPAVEAGILTYIICRVRQAIRSFRRHSGESPDFYTTLKKTCGQFLPKGLVNLAVTEIAVFYYGFVYWKRRELRENEFSYHRDSGTVSLLMAIIFIIAIETTVFHILLLKWSPAAAWILTAISIYSGIQLFGFLKSMLKRPYSVVGDRLLLHYGIMAETEIEFGKIESVELASGDFEFNDQTRKLSFLGSLEGYNVVIRLKEENELTGLYGRIRKYRNIAVYVDDKSGFRDLIEARL